LDANHEVEDSLEVSSQEWDDALPEPFEVSLERIRRELDNQKRDRALMERKTSRVRTLDDEEYDR
jgi:hypothetical protein